MLRTRPSTPIWTQLHETDEDVQFLERPLGMFGRLDKRVFTELHVSTYERSKKLLTTELEEVIFLKNEFLKKRTPRDEARQEHKDKINQKRAFIARCIRHQPLLSLKAVARLTKADYATVKRVSLDLKFQGEVSQYEYNHLKSPEELEALHETISHATETFSTVTDLKKVHPKFSKKRILKELHSRGFHWDKLPKQRKRERYEPPNSRDVCKVIGHLAQALGDKTADVFFVDEMKLPLYQTPEYHWCRRDQPAPVVYTGEMSGKYSSLPLLFALSGDSKRFRCSEKRSLELTLPTFSTMPFPVSTLPRGSLCSQTEQVGTRRPSFRSKSPLTRSPAYKMLCFNIPHMFQLNLIENGFSFIRNNFRKRATVGTIEEEAKAILSLFFDPKNEQRFRGIYRNHLRSLLKYLEIHKRGAPSF